MEHQSEFAYMWEYLVREDGLDTFRRVYGPRGDWVELFRRDDTYCRPELYQDVANPRRFVTTDFWTSKAARDAFRQRFKKEFDELDRRCEALTETERFLGDFHTL